MHHGGHSEKRAGLKSFICAILLGYCLPGFWEGRESQIRTTAGAVQQNDWHGPRNFF
jgi:hypothetical protein